MSAFIMQYFHKTITFSRHKNMLILEGDFRLTISDYGSTDEVNRVNEYWGKQRGFDKRFDCDKRFDHDKRFDCDKRFDHDKRFDCDKHCDHDKHCPKPCNPPKPCEDKQCHFCGFVWRKCPCCGKCCCCKVWICDHTFVFQCGECGEVFWADCEEDCWKK